MVRKGFARKLIEQFIRLGDKTNAFCVRDDVEDRDISYGEFARDILAAAGWFREHGVTGQNVALISEADYYFYVSLFAAWAAGNVAVLVNPDLPAKMVDTLCQKTDVAVACASEAVEEALQGRIAVQTWIRSNRLPVAAPIALDEIHDAQDDETILLLFTSGTTGVSKAAEITRFGFQYCVEWMNALYETPGPESAFHVIPRYHIYGIQLAVVCFNRGETLNLGRSLRSLITNLTTFHPSYVVMVPAMASSLVRLLKRADTQEEREKIAGKCLKRVCLLGAKVSMKLAQDLEDLGIELEVCYGMTEASCISWGIISPEKVGSVGKVCPGVQVRIIDGEIQAKNPTVMKGYYKEPLETAKVLKDGWMCTGDLGYVDEDGYCYLTGRKKNVIILSNGENVSPEEMENMMYSCESILECMVYSDGKGICADIYTQQSDAVAAYIKQFNDEMPLYRQIYKVYYQTEPLEKTSNGKIKRKENK